MFQNNVGHASFYASLQRQVKSSSNNFISPIA